MKTTLRILSLSLALTLSCVAFAGTSGTSRYDGAIQSEATQKLAAKKEFREVKASLEDGIVTLTGNVTLYQQKLDAAKAVRKLDKAQGVRNLIEVAGTDVPDPQLSAQLNRKLYYDRMGYDNLFNFITASAQNGVVTLNGEARIDIDRDSALWIASTMPGVKDIVDNIKVEPVSIFDDRIRVQAARVIYRDPALSRYAIDPARPIRIVVDNGKLALYGTVASSMDKDIAGIRASQVFGAFSVQNNLQVEKKS
jgi:hyperosmotically inducible periplasmic protein